METIQTSMAFNFWNKPAVQTEQVERYFYRCPNCLIVAALDSKPRPFAECDTCRDESGAAHMEFIGRVEQDKLIREYDRPVCDDRCTSARGPSCNCKCGGVNHGSHLWVTVRVVNDIPVVPAPVKAEKYRYQAKEFKNAVDNARKKLIAVIGPDTAEAISQGKWINDKSAWMKDHFFWKAINKARAMREHKSRMRQVEKAIKGLEVHHG